MFSHDQIWTGIDRLAAGFGYSPSGLAKKAGLDPTSFNRSKRTSPDGKPRWPSTESLSKILLATGATMSDFISLIGADERHESGSAAPAGSLPMIGFAQAGMDGYFDEEGYPKGEGWDYIAPPLTKGGKKTDENSFALQVSGQSMAPLFRDGDVLIVSPQSRIRKDDRVVVKTTKGEVMAKELLRQNAGGIKLRSLNPDFADRNLDQGEIAWIARILWVSQ